MSCREQPLEFVNQKVGQDRNLLQSSAWHKHRLLRCNGQKRLVLASFKNTVDLDIRRTEIDGAGYLKKNRPEDGKERLKQAGSEGCPRFCLLRHMAAEFLCARLQAWAFPATAGESVPE